MSVLATVFFILAPLVVFALVVYMLRDEFAANWRGLICIAAAAVLFFHRILFFGEALSQSDANLLQLQFFSIYRESILDFGEIPFWNPHVGAGVPNLANPLSAMFYPFAPLFLVVDVFKAMDIVVVFHYFLAGAFALFLGRKCFTTQAAAVAFALLYAFNGWAVTRAAHQPAIEYLFAYAWLPLAAVALERAIDGRSLLSSAVIAGAALAWMGMTCPNVFVYGALLLALAFALRLVFLIVSGRRNAFAAGLSVAIGTAVFAFALGAVEYEPARELARFASGGRLGAEIPGGWRTQGLSLVDLVRLYFPYAPGRPFGVYYSPGIVACACALFAVYAAIRLRTRRIFVAACLIILALGAALAVKSPLYTVLTAASRFFALASLMPASLILLVLPVAALAAAGVEAVAHEYRRLSGARSYVLPALIFIELFVGLAVIYPRWGERSLTFKYADEVADFPHLDLIVSKGDPGRVLVVSPAEGEVIAPSYAVLSRGLSRVNLHPSDFAPDWLTRAVDAADTDLRSLSALGVGWIAANEPVSGLGDAQIVPWPQVRTHREDNVFFPLRNLAGWATWSGNVYLYQTSTLPVIMRAEPLTRESIIQGASEKPLAGLADADLRAFADWNPMPLVNETANSLAAVLPESAPTRYFFSVTAYPGWRVFADGREVSSATAAGAFLAADVPEKTRVVELRFEPTHWGFCISLAALALVAAVVVAGRESKSV